MYLSWCITSFRPGDAIWWHGTRSTLAQVMACCLTAPSHYLNQCWLIIGEVPWHLRALSLKVVKIPINKTRFKMAVLKCHIGLPGANELREKHVYPAMWAVEWWLILWHAIYLHMMHASFIYRIAQGIKSLQFGYNLSLSHWSNI